MFKRLFFLSGIIAFGLAVFTMCFWYLPNHPEIDASQPAKLNQPSADTVVVDTTYTK
jgi:hypothetical protein